ncbi:MAG: AMP-binding protein [Deltaproteobacteria bacterium]|nr:AMP-binding protein [Deltaproteobacteria bacterium]
MNLDGFTPYDSKAAEGYEKKRWWLGLTLGDMLDKASDLYPAKEALVGQGKRYTYKELRSQADTLACSLLRLGFNPGDRVLLQLPNWPEFVISYFALQKAGLIMVLLTINHTAREVSHLAELTQPRGWIVPDHYRKSEFFPLIEQVQSQNRCLQQIILVSPARPVKKDGKLWFDDLVTRQVSSSEIERTLEGARPDPGNVCQILPSGGTTGLPKGAPRTHNDYICNVEYTSRAWDVNVTDTCLVTSTVGHNLALLVCVTGPLFHGATVVLMDSTHPQDFCRLVQEEKVTCTGLVPTLISRIVNYEGLENYDLSSLKKIYVGAANSPPELVRSVESKMGARYINAFGMVEGPCSQSRPDDPIEIRFNTIGRPVCPYDLFITLDPDGNQTPPGVEGELAAKGPGVFTGYFKNPQANQKAFSLDGFFRTGDLAVIDGQGIIRITGRIKDIIIRGGENIAARDVEDLVSSYPGVEYVAVIGMPDPDLGEQVCAFIKPLAGSEITLEEIRRYLEKMGAPKAHLPARVELVSLIPLTAAGKADKKVLKQRIEDIVRNALNPTLKE